jgi:hypothetical protein
VGTNAIDGNPATYWHTRWTGTTDPLPHTITLNLNGTYAVKGFRYLPRQDGQTNGTIAQYRFETSMDNISWTMLSSGTLGADTTQKDIVIQTSQQAKYVRLTALSEINGGPWTTIAELNIYGTPAASGGPTACSQYTPTTPIPTGFGSPYDVVTSPTTNLIQTTCPSTGSGQARIDLGKGDPLQYIYNTGYLFKTGGTSWAPIPYTSTESLIANAWYPKSANTTIAMTSTELANPSYVLAYLCTWTGTNWKCGCRDQACAQSYWQIQSFKK